MDDFALLEELLAKLVGSLKADYAVDPVIGGLLSQLIAVLAPEAEPLPQNTIDSLTPIETKIERFKQAAMKLGSLDPNNLKALAESMKASGLLKTEESAELQRAKKADLVTFPKNVKGAVCSNCRFVDIEKSYCDHKEVDQPLPDGVDRMCCSFWDAEGTKRQWER